MNIVFKSNIKKSVVLLTAVTVISVLVYNIKGTPFYDVALALTGQNSLAGLPDKLLFVTFVFIVQYFYSDTILYCIDNYDYLLIRYKSKSGLFVSLRKELIKSTVVITVIVSIIILSLSIILDGAVNSRLVFLCINLFLLLSVISFLQALLLIKTNTEKTLLIILGLSIVYTLISQTAGNYTEEFDGLTFSLIRIVLGILLTSILYLSFKKNFMKEWKAYAN